MNKIYIEAQLFDSDPEEEDGRFILKLDKDFRLTHIGKWKMKFMGAFCWHKFSWGSKAFEFIRLIPYEEIPIHLSGDE